MDKKRENSVFPLVLSGLPVVNMLAFIKNSETRKELKEELKKEIKDEIKNEIKDEIKNELREELRRELSQKGDDDFFSTFIEVEALHSGEN